jgi:thioredoxin-related protein
MSFRGKGVVSTLLMSLVTVSILCAQGISFESYDIRNWDKIAARQKEVNRCAFIYVYSENAPACQAMVAQTFNDQDLANFINVHFVNIRVNMDSAYGVEFAKKYHVNCYPAYLIFNRSDLLFQRTAGFIPLRDFYSFCESEKAESVNTFDAFQRDYDVPDATPAVALTYLKVLSQNCFETNDTAVSFLKTQKQSDYILPGNWKIINDYVTDVISAPFKYVVNNRNDFVAKYSLDTVNNKLFDCYLSYGRTLIFAQKFDQNKYKAYRAEVSTVKFERSEELGLMLDFMFAEAQGNLKNYCLAATNLINKYKATDPDFLNQASRLLLKKSKDKKQLTLALGWAQKSTELKPGWQNLDTYAQLIFKAGDKTHAIENERKAIDMAKAEYTDTTQLSATLKTFDQVK